MQAVSLEITDHLPIQVDLMEVTASVVQAVHPAAVGWLGLDQITELIVMMLQFSCITLLPDELPQRVIPKSELLLPPLVVGKRDGRKLIQRIVGVFCFAVCGDLRRQAACSVAFQVMINRCYGRRRDDVQASPEGCGNTGRQDDVVELVVGVALGAAIEILLLYQPVSGIPGKPIAFAILIRQCVQATIVVVTESHLPTMGVCAQTDLSPSVVLIVSSVPCEVRIGGQLSARVTPKMFRSTIG